VETDARLTELIQKNERVQITRDLRQESGCELSVAKLWVYHKTYVNPQTAPEKFASRTAGSLCEQLAQSNAVFVGETGIKCGQYQLRRFRR
jgi:hypothetical protein